MRVKRIKIRKTFDAIADRYILANHILSFGQDICWRKKMCEKVSEHLKTNNLVLDIATGTGENFKYCPSKFKTKIGLDPARNMLLKARERFLDVTFVEGMAEELPFKNNLADLILVSFGVRNFENRQKAFREFNRVLKKDGIVAILEFFPMENGTLLNKAAAFYIYKILPYFGGLITGNFDAYKYLSISIQNFVSPEIMKMELEQNNLKVVEKEKIFPDVYIFVAKKE
ncbi:ubiquinone/menaquinone biosynthesis methyltransferase [Persephonella sp. IF05-L8]|uniref:ubiquinone/menaquinone biosynthesis methyltransferase n=1 Tax=Persephonella sp. IF05-L8 TaxID=1158338 RepID=UPI000497381F